MPAPLFHTLRIASIQAETSDAISVAFHVPNELREAYRFLPGQFLTLKSKVGSEELRRSYSICISPQDFTGGADLRIGIKRVTGGRFSNWANDQFKPGQSIEVMTPDGRFYRPAHAKARHLLGIAGGSGITPMLSLIANALNATSDARFTLLYGNRHTASIMFLENLSALKNTYLDRLQLIHVLSEEHQDIEWMNGLLDQKRCESILIRHGLHNRIDQAYICGPEPMMKAAELALAALGLASNKISVERFGSPDSGTTPATASATAPAAITPPDDQTPKANVRLIVDGKTRVLKLAYQGQAVLDAGLAAGANLPYACKAGVCCTCRAKVLEGEVRMDKNFTLEADEIARGFVLTCQCHPVSDSVTISFDDR
jgi:ring-1,2-phenylacetyl-CoA epoxidase subunit PaaE